MPASTSIPDPRQIRLLQDLLPPFWSLTTDEERERKAESVNPGTYHVVANPSSFKSLPEYQDKDGSSCSYPGGPDDLGDFDQEDRFSDSRRAVLADPPDPNVVILKKFADPLRRSTPQPSTRPTTTPASPASFHVSAGGTSQATCEDLQLGLGNSTRTFEVLRHGGRDIQLLQHYQRVVSLVVFGRERSMTEEDMFEVEARTYPPVSGKPILKISFPGKS